MKGTQKLRYIKIDTLYYISLNMKFDFKDIVLVPEVLSSISSRSEIDITDEFGKLPLIVSPMDTVINEGNSELFEKLGFTVCLPRGENVTENQFRSISLDDFEILTDYLVVTNDYLLVDIANGHMEKLYSLCEKFLEKNNGDKLMIGNIANPKTYKKFAEIGVGFIRVGIGGGSGCLTSANTGVHYPMASLINECYQFKKDNGYTTKIVADGGFRNYDDIIKAIALGADYVMLGGMLNKSLESCSPVKLFGKLKISTKFANKLWANYPKLRKFFYKDFRGMSTKEVQKKWGRKNIKTSEGVHRVNKVEYKLDTWVDNFKDYLKSAMSYTNSKNLNSFRYSEFVKITENAYKRFNK